MDAEKLKNWLLQWKEVLAAAALLLTTAAGLWKTATLQLDPTAWSLREGSFLSLAVLTLGLVALLFKRARGSRLIDPDALKLDPQSPDQLVGRGDDLARLRTALTSPLLFLVSESGCGKSALLRAGVMRDPSIVERFLPLYIDMSVLDWEEGPLRVAREEFSRSLPLDDVARGKLDSQSKPRDYVDVFSDYKKRAQRQPLLLLDQFDDYQAKPQHRERFLPSDSRVWRNADAIARENAFWRVLRQCLQNEAVGIVAVCRDDAVAGLEALRFHSNVPQFDLPRLERGLVRLLLDRLTNRPGVIADPERGWTALRNRLADEIETRGQILPQQLKIVFGGLRELTQLNLVAYSRVGRVGGLEAAFIGGAIARAATIAGLRSDGPVLRMLSSLVDHTRQPPDKSPPKTTQQLAALSVLQEEVTSRVLSQLSRDKIIRLRQDTVTSIIAWQLDHAYLAKPILQLDSNRNSLRILLSENAARYTESSSILARWQCLLPVFVQMKMLTAKIRGTLRYGEHRNYALISALRVLPIVAVVVVAISVVWVANEYEAASRIEAQLSFMLINRNGLTDDAADGLAELTTRSGVTRWRIEKDIFQSATYAELFNTVPEQVLRAIVGLDRDRLRGMIVTYLTAERMTQPDDTLRVATNHLLDGISLAAETEDTRRKFEFAFKEALSERLTQLDPETIAEGFRVILTSPQRGDPDAFPSVIPMLHAAIGKSADPRQLSVLAKVYADARTQIGDTDLQAFDILAAIRAAIGRAKGQEGIEELAPAYATVAATLKSPDQQAFDVLAAIRAAIRSGDVSYGSEVSARAYAAIVALLKDGDHRVVDELSALESDMDRWPQEIWTQSYMGLAAKLNVADRQASYRLSNLAAALKKSVYGREIASLARTYAALGVNFKSQHLPTFDFLAAIRDEIGKSENANSTHELVQAYTEVVSLLKDQDVEGQDVQEFSALRSAIANEQTSYQLAALVQAYTALAAEFKDPDPQAAGITAIVLAAIARSAHSHDIAGQLHGILELAPAYEAVAVTLRNSDHSQVFDVLSAIHAAIKNCLAEDDCDHLAQAYKAVVALLKSGDPRAAQELSALRSEMAPRQYATRLVAWIDTYVAIAAKVDDAPPAPDLRGRLSEAMRENRAETLPLLVRAYTEIASLFQDDHDPHASFDVFNALMKATHGSYSDDYLNNYFSEIVTRMSVPADTDFLDRTREAIISTTNINEIPMLTQLYLKILTVSNIKDRHASDVLAAQLAAIARSTDHDHQLGALASAYATTASTIQSLSSPMPAIGLLLDRLSAVRGTADCSAFAAAIREAVRLEVPALPWDKVGLVYTAALLQPVCAGAPSRILVRDYENFIRQNPSVPHLPKSSWNDDVWAFVSWAQDNLPGFDPHKANVWFLPPVPPPPLPIKHEKIIPA